MSNDHRFLADVYGDEDVGLSLQVNVWPYSSPQSTRLSLSGIPTPTLSSSELSCKVNLFLYWCSR